MLIGTTLKKLRESKRLTVEQVAEHLSVSASSYRKYEYNEREPSTDVIIEIADFYNVTTDMLLGREKPSPNPVTLLNLPDDTEAVVDAISKMPVATQKIMVDLLLQLADSVNMRRDSAEDNVREIVKTILKTVYYDAASAGTGEPLGDEPPEQIEIIATPEAEAADCVIRVHGDSMEDTFSDGDLVLVKYQETLGIGEVGVFVLNNEGYIKEYGRDRLVSHNPKYDDIPLHEYDDLRCTGRVIGVAEIPE